MQEYETVMKGLDRNAPSVPPQNSPQEAQQVEMWKKYIQWEKSNPLRTEDQTLITKRGDVCLHKKLYDVFCTILPSCDSSHFSVGVSFMSPVIVYFILSLFHG